MNACGVEECYHRGRSDLSTSELIPEGKEEVERGRLMLPDRGRLIGGKVTGRLMT